MPMARAAFEAISTPWRKPKPEEQADSYADLMRAGFGPTLYEQVYAPYARKLWGVAGERVDAEQARRKAGAPTAISALARAVRTALSYESLAYFYPRRGFGQLCETMADAAVRRARGCGSAARRSGSSRPRRGLGAARPVRVPLGRGRAQRLDRRRPLSRRLLAAGPARVLHACRCRCWPG